MIHMTLYWGKKVTLLFHWWRTKSWAGYTFSVVAVFLAAAFFQFMEARRLRFKALALHGPNMFSTASTEAAFLGFSPKAAAAVVFAVNLAIGYLLMLIVMSCNGGVFAAVIIGQAVGYFTFRCGGGENGIAVGKPRACF